MLAENQIKSLLTTPLPFLTGTRGSSKLQNLVFITFSAIYAYVLATVIYDGIPDRLNYLNYATNSVLILFRYLNEGILTIILNEPLWLLLNIITSHLFESEVVIKIFIIIPAFTVAFLVLKSNPQNALWLLLFLLLPQIVKNHFTQIRQGVALSIFLIGYFSDNNYLKWFVFVLTPFIHSSFVFVLILYMISIFIKKLKFSWDLRAFSYIIFGVSISALTFIIGSYLPIRQIQRLEEVEFIRMIGLGFVYWSFVASMMLLNGSSYIKKNSFEVGAVLFYVGSYIFFPWSARIFESLLILVIISGLNMKSIYKLPFAISLLIYGLVDWLKIFTIGSSMFGL